ncbi:MAG: HAD-IA family hydrolase, partial [Acidiferrobacteraceae bacterium]
LRPGVARLLSEARAAGVRLAIATTTTEDNVRALLESALGSVAMTWFEVIGAGDVVPAKKPASDIYQYVLRALSVPPASCIAFEDSRNGLLSALGAGVPTVITVNDYTRDQSFDGAALVLSDLGEPGAPARVLGPSPSGPSLCITLPVLRGLLGHDAVAPARGQPAGRSGS